jgi:hypothetical protein
VAVSPDGNVSAIDPTTVQTDGYGDPIYPIVTALRFLRQSRERALLWLHILVVCMSMMVPTSLQVGSSMLDRVACSRKTTRF